MKKTYIFFVILVFLNSSCVTLLLPSKQRVAITTNNTESSVYIEKEKVGEGSSISTKVKKNGVKQIVVQTPGYEDAFYAMMQVRRPAAFYPMIALDLPFMIAFLFPAYDFYIPKGYAYDASYAMPPLQKFEKKPDSCLYTRLEAISFDMKNTDVDFPLHKHYYYGSIQATIDKINALEQSKSNKALKKEKKSGTQVKRLETKSKEMIGISNSMSSFADDILKKNGYVDTVNNLLLDNTALMLEGKIRKIDVYDICGPMQCHIYRSRINMLWKIKNSYGELLDTLNLISYSGDHKSIDFSDLSNGELFRNMMTSSVYQLLGNKNFVALNQTKPQYTISDTVFTLSKPTQVVRDVSDASMASVIIKNGKKGHGSGFAITNDGYLLTNFHVIAGDELGKIGEIKVVTSNGIELPAKVIRYNRYCDVALLKIDYNFDKAFELIATKGYKNLIQVYTIGAPKSIELGQSVSLGLVSNERQMKTLPMMQISISVNPGNSGGPLFDQTGTLHGIVTSKLVGYATEGVGFAIPSYKIAEYLNLRL